ncbi:MAG: RnfABCDGE type electron transport complex subunit D [Actinomycetota bacterium]|nr:RnfABCDGE type electron transport complex subunit D [Actinomycetota bacterium]
MNRELLVGVSPHLHEKDQNIERAMRDVLIALCPAAVVAIVVFGMNAFYIMAVSMIVAVLSEFVVRKIFRRKTSVNDLSALVTGLLFAFLLPPTTPLWVVAIGAFIAVGIAKELFGGLGKNVFNPALFARVALMISPLSMYVSKFVKPFYWRHTGFFSNVITSIDESVAGRIVYKGITGNVYMNAVTSATPLSLMKSGRMLVDTVTGPTPVGATWLTSGGRPSLWSMFLGCKAGSIGEISILALLVGAAYLLYRRTIDWRIPAGILGSFLIVMLIAWNNPVYELLGGGLVLGAFYMATDWVTSPSSKSGRWIYAIGIGIAIALFRLLSPWPEGTAIVILHFNVIALLIDRYIAAPKFGALKKRWINKLPVSP